MKKTTKVVPLALILVALLSSMCGCNTENTNNRNDTTEEISSAGENDNTYIEEVDTSKLVYYATYDNVAFYKDEQEQWYAYIEGWNTYRKLGNINGAVYDALLSGNTVEILMIDAYRQDKNTSVSTIKLTRYNEETEIAENELDFKLYREGRENEFFVNYYAEGCAYLFYMPIYNGKYDWPLIRYATIDGGKTWVNQYDELNIHTTEGWHSYPDTAKFINKEIGIVSYRCVGDADLCKRTYLTIDCGKTWNKITELQYPFDFYDPNKPYEENGYTEVLDLAFIDNQYVLTIVHRFNDNRTTYKYITNDFENWTSIN